MSLPHQKLEAIEEIDKLSATRGSSAISHAAEDLRVAPNKEHFEALLTPPQGDETSTAMARKIATPQTSLIDEVAAMGKKVDQVSRVTPTELVAQADQVVGQMEALKNKLNTPDIAIKDSMQGMLRNKLTHIDESLQVALSKAGVEYQIPKTALAANASPIERFLGMLSDSQRQIQGLTGHIAAMGLTKEEISPATMLMMQVKVGFVQQEIELFTSLLSKALESTKTIMNVQV
jgi:hypothetical protein